jgi:DNA-binding transcriptional MerR regulator
MSETTVGSSVLETSGDTLDMSSYTEIMPTLPLDIIEKKDQANLSEALFDELLLQEIESIPQQMAFKIGDVADLLGIKQYVLRYWESEFDILRPKKAANNQRMYARRDVENAFLIRKLLHRDRFSIPGARAALKDLKTVVKKEKEWSSVHQRLDDKLDDLLQDIRGLRELFQR